MRTFRLFGTPQQMGRAFGEETRDEIQKLYAARLQTAIDQAKSYGGQVVGEAEVLEIARR